MGQALRDLGSREDIVVRRIPRLRGHRTDEYAADATDMIELYQCIAVRLTFSYWTEQEEEGLSSSFP